MDKPILITGGTGKLGQVLVSQLKEAGHEVRVMSRHAGTLGEPPPSRAVADLLTGEGVARAVRGTGVIIHCATSNNRKKDELATKSLVEAALQAGNPHLVYISIVGVDRIPLGYYQGKLASEKIIEQSGVPYTILRATQFHDLLHAALAGLAKLPVMFVPKIRFQPIDIREVATRLRELATGDPLGRAQDIGGPEISDTRELAQIYLEKTSKRRRIISISLPGKTFHAYQQGGNLTPENLSGKITFSDWLTE